MPQIKSILCPVDFSEFSVNAYEYAQSLAWHYKAALFLQHVLYPLYSSFAAYGGDTESYEKGCRQLQTEAEQKLQQFAKRHACTTIRPQCLVQDGAVTDLIVAQAEARAANLIVMGTHGGGGIEQLKLGSVTNSVLRRARCPVLAVRKPAHHVISSVHASAPVFLRKIVLCADFSNHDHRASEYAVSAKEYGAELTLLHVLEDVPRSADLKAQPTRRQNSWRNPLRRKDSRGASSKCWYESASHTSRSFSSPLKHKLTW
jgi:universal stress protein A